MRFSAIDLELSIDGTSEPVVRNHTANCALDQQFRMTRASRLNVLGFMPAHVAGKTHEGLLLFLFAGDTDLLGVDDDHEVTGIDMRRENRLLFAAQKFRRLHRDAAEHLIFSVDQPPFAVDFICFGGKRLHWRLEKGTEATGHGGHCQPAESAARAGIEGPHARYRTVCSIDVAGGYAERA